MLSFSYWPKLAVSCFKAAWKASVQLALCLLCKSGHMNNNEAMRQCPGYQM